MLKKQLLDSRIVAFQQQLDLTRVRQQAGIASDEDVAQAETQLETTQAQATDLGIQRAQLEHAIAVLMRQPPASFSLPITPLDAQPPVWFQSVLLLNCWSRGDVRASHGLRPFLRGWSTATEGGSSFSGGVLSSTGVSCIDEILVKNNGCFY